MTNKHIKFLTNGLFSFGVVSGDFNCRLCASLITLEGSPKVIGKDFICSWCYSLKDLKGSPEKVGGKIIK